MLDLIVESSIQEAQEGAANIGRGSNLLVQERGIVVLGIVTVKHFGTHKVVANDEEKGKVIPANDKHWSNVEQCENGGNLIKWDDNPTDEENSSAEDFKKPLRFDQRRHGGKMLPLDNIEEAFRDDIKAEQGNKKKEVNVLHDMPLHEGLERVEAQNRTARQVWIVIDIIAVHVVLHDMLVNPINSAASNPVLT